MVGILVGLVHGPTGLFLSPEALLMEVESHPARLMLVEAKWQGYLAIGRGPWQIGIDR